MAAAPADLSPRPGQAGRAFRRAETEGSGWRPTGMSLFGAMIAANQRLQRELRAMDERLPRRRLSTAAISSQAPRTFALYLDPGKRFELRYPKDWVLEVAEGIQVYSASLGTFVQVAVLPEGLDPWARLQAEARKGKLGGVLRDFRAQGEQASGILEAEPYVFEWEARRYPGGLVLVTGNVLDSKRSKAVEAYEDTVLAAIRRHFKVMGRG